MIITWHGFACFKIQHQPALNKELVIVTDPFKTTGTGGRLPKGAVDIITISTPELDYHNNFPPFLQQNKEAKTITGPGEYEIKGVFIFGQRGVNTKTKTPLPVTMYSLEIDGIRLAHLGAWGTPQLNEEQLEFFKGVGVVCLPITGGYYLEPLEAAQLVAQLEPAVIIPMGFSPKATEDKKKLEGFLREVGGEIERGVKKFRLSSKDIKEAQEGQTKIVVFEV